MRSSNPDTEIDPCQVPSTPEAGGCKAAPSERQHTASETSTDVRANKHLKFVTPVLTLQPPFRLNSAM